MFHPAHPEDPALISLFDNTESQTTQALPPSAGPFSYSTRNNQKKLSDWGLRSSLKKCIKIFIEFREEGPKWEWHTWLETLSNQVILGF